MMVPDMSLAVAEAYATEGKKVLVLLTDMTNYSDALKEISITMEQIPAEPWLSGRPLLSACCALRKSG